MDDPRRETRSQRKRAAIITAAAQAFRDEGYESTSMDRVAELARVSKRTVYNHFRSKEALLGVVFEQQLARVAEAVRVPFDPARSLEAQLREFARQKLSILQDPVWMGLLRVALGVFVRRPELARRTTTSADESDDALVTWLVAARAAGRVHAEDPRRAASQFWALIKGELFWPAVFGAGHGPAAPASADAARERVIDEAITTFLCRYRAENSSTPSSSGP